MLELFAKLNTWLGKRMFMPVIVALILGYFLSLPDSPTIRATVVILFAYMTFITALSTSFRQFFKVLKKPFIPIWILLLVHFVTPLIAWCTGLLLFPDAPYTRLGYLVGASIPIGVTSIIWTSLVKGNTAIALVAVTLDTLIVPLFLPLYFKMIIGQTVAINYLEMVEEMLLMITLPSILGMALHDLTNGRLNEFSRTIGGFSSKVAFFFVILLNASIVLPIITWDASALKITFVTAFIVAVGYFTGYLGSLILQRSRELTLTMIYNVGMRNIAFGIVLAVTFFPPEVAVPITLSMLFQQPIAAVVPLLYSRRSQTNR